jgi:hypothetical protein
VRVAARTLLCRWLHLLLYAAPSRRYFVAAELFRTAASKRLLPLVLQWCLKRYIKQLSARHKLACPDDLLTAQMDHLVSSTAGRGDARLSRPADAGTAQRRARARQRR